MALMALTLALSAAFGADAPVPAAPEASSVAPAQAPNAQATKARVHPSPTHRTVEQGIDQSVRRLTLGLGLDLAQQAKLREILRDQHRQAMKLRTDNSEPGTDRAAATFAILEQTKARIRAMLNEEQRKKYSADVPREQTAPAQADLQHWLQLQELQRSKGEDESK
jgi:hypothetical protein